MKTLLKQFLMKLWSIEVITDRETELLIHFFAVEEA
jgi:hypothetical protein